MEKERIADGIKNGILGVIVGGVSAFLAGILLNYIFFYLSTKVLFAIYPEHFFLQKLLRPLVEKHSFFLSTLDYYSDHFITSVGTAQFDFKFGILGWEMNLGNANLKTLLYFPFLSTILTPALAILFGGWIAGKIMGDKFEKWHKWAGLLTAIPYTLILWWGRHYVTAQWDKFSQTFAFVFQIQSIFKLFPLEWQIWLWGLLLGGSFGFIGGYLSGRSKAATLLPSARLVLYFAGRAFFLTGAGVTIIALNIALIDVWREYGKWIPFVVFIISVAVIFLLKNRYIIWGTVLCFMLSFWGLALSNFYLAHGVAFKGKLAAGNMNSNGGITNFNKKPDSNKTNKIQVGLLEGYPSFYSIKEIFSLKGFFALSEVLKGWRHGFVEQQQFPWYWKMLPLIPFSMLLWHGYLLEKDMPKNSFIFGWAALMSSWYALLMLLFLPFVENRFVLSGQAWFIKLGFDFIFAPSGGQVFFNSFLLALIAVSTGLWLASIFRRKGEIV